MALICMDECSKEQRFFVIMNYISLIIATGLEVMDYNQNEPRLKSLELWLF